MIESERIFKRHKLIVTLLTVMRAPLVLIASLIALLHCARPTVLGAVLIVLCLALSAITDMLDGKYARKWGVTSRFGALADPLMDKIFYVATIPVATFLVLRSYIECREPSILVHACVLLALDLVSMLRDQLVTFYRAVGSDYKADVRANWSGKLRTAFGFPVIVALYLYIAVDAIVTSGMASPMPIWPGVVLIVFELFLAAITLISLIVYSRQYAPYIRMSINSSEPLSIKVSDEEEMPGKISDSALESIQLAAMRYRTASIGGVVSSVVHDFNNALTVVQVGVDMQTSKGISEADRKEGLAAIKQATSQIALILTHLQAYAGLGSIDFAPVDLNEMLSNKWPMLRTQVPNNIRLQLDEYPMLPKILADQGQLVRVLQNLLRNSTEAIDGKEGVICIATKLMRDIDFEKPDYITIEPRMGEKYVAFSVEDTGCGIKKEFVKELMLPMKSTKGAGRGVGLMSVKAIMDAHGGVIVVRSEEGRGTKFEVAFPAIISTKELLDKQAAGSIVRENAVRAAAPAAVEERKGE